MAPMEKAYFIVPMEYSPNGKDIIARMEYILIAYSPNCFFKW